ncbi:MAG: IS630 family transposase [Gemmataceae bacterium]
MKTSLQPGRVCRQRWPLNPDRSASNTRYQRKGALNLFAAFDTRTGKVYAHTAERKRQKEFIEFLEQLESEIPASVTKIHLVMDNLRMRTGKQVQAWLEKHPRFKFHHPPVHCSWMNQVEQWFSILQRKRLAIADFADRTHLASNCMRS